MPTSLLMQFQRQSVRVMEESHLLSGIIVNPNRLTFNTDFCQLIHRLLHAINTERKMTQTTGLRPVYTLRRVFLSKNLQFRVFINTKIQLPVLALRAIVFSDDRETQLVYIEILSCFVVRYDDCNMMYFLINSFFSRSISFISITNYMATFKKDRVVNFQYFYDSF
mgnify:CR=1 FL=1